MKRIETHATSSIVVFKFSLVKTARSEYDAEFGQRAGGQFENLEDQTIRTWSENSTIKFKYVSMQWFLESFLKLCYRLWRFSFIWVILRWSKLNCEEASWIRGETFWRSQKKRCPQVSLPQPVLLFWNVGAVTGRGNHTGNDTTSMTPKW